MFVLNYLTVLVCTKGIIFFNKYPPLATSTLANNCYIAVKLPKISFYRGKANMYFFNCIQSTLQDGHLWDQ